MQLQRPGGAVRVWTGPGPRIAATLGAAAVWAASCSTLAPLPEAKVCESNADCAESEICALDQGVCLEVSPPPLRHLGLDLTEPPLAAGESFAFRSEIHGCDREVVLQSTLDETYRIRKGNLVETLILDVADRTGDEPVPVESSLQLATPSRLATAPTSATLTFPTLDVDDNVVDTTKQWAHYHPSESYEAPGFGAGVPIRVRALPIDGGAPAYRYVNTWATEPGQSCTEDVDCCPPDMPQHRCDPDVPDVCVDVGDDMKECSWGGSGRWAYSLPYDPLCDRVTIGEVTRVNTEMAEVGKVSEPLVRFLHGAPEDPDDRLSVAVVSGPLPELTCMADEDCEPGHLCRMAPGEDTGQCALDLTGLEATPGSVQADPMGGFTARVYTYCEQESGIPLDRPLVARVDPPTDGQGGVVPSGSFEFLQTYSAPTMDEKPVSYLLGDLCLPDWGAPTSLDVRLTAEPVVVWGEGEDAWRCCDTSCLANAVEADGTLPEGPPPAPESCDKPPAIPQSIVVEAGWAPDDEDAWAAADCKPVQLDKRGNAGYLRRTAECVEGSCVATGLGAGPDGEPRAYDVRIEPPPRSVFASVTLPPVDVTAAPTVHPTELTRRVMVRGYVTLSPEVCDPAKDSGCDRVNALVVAERLKMPGDDETPPPGPYFHTAPTFTDPIDGGEGAYVLPLDPGVWLVTALPLAGSRGDPARIEVLDLRDEKDRNKEFVLSLGVRVNFKLSGFDSRTEVVPLDLGSWEKDPHPWKDGFLRLNDPDECLSSPSEGCQIRKLLPPGAAVRPNAVNIVQIAARSAPSGGGC